MQEIKATESCETLLNSGHTAPGYYWIDGPGELNFDLVKCNLNLEPSDPQFEKKTMAKLAEFPVAFDLYRNVWYSSNGTVVTYEGSHVNVGGAMTTEGIFTAPLDGVYVFSYCGHTYSTYYGNPMTTVQIRVDSTAVSSYSIKATANYGDHVTGITQAIVSLMKGQKVDAYLYSGRSQTVYSNDTHFTGYLIHPL